MPTFERPDTQQEVLHRIAPGDDESPRAKGHTYTNDTRHTLDVVVQEVYLRYDLYETGGQRNGGSLAHTWMGDDWKLIQQTRGTWTAGGIPRPHAALEEQSKRQERWLRKNREGTYSTYVKFQAVTVNYRYSEPTSPAHGPGFRFPGKDPAIDYINWDSPGELLLQSQAANHIIRMYNEGKRKDLPALVQGQFILDRT
jgi:hypothetical protein